jgi:hypothetical protein
VRLRVNADEGFSGCGAIVSGPIETALRRKKFSPNGQVQGLTSINARFARNGFSCGQVKQENHRWKRAGKSIAIVPTGLSGYSFVETG